jgi:hypothetical protein
MCIAGRVRLRNEFGRLELLPLDEPFTMQQAINLFGAIESIDMLKYTIEDRFHADMFAWRYAARLLRQLGKVIPLNHPAHELVAQSIPEVFKHLAGKIDGERFRYMILCPLNADVVRLLSRYSVATNKIERQLRAVNIAWGLMATLPTRIIQGLMIQLRDSTAPSKDKLAIKAELVAILDGRMSVDELEMPYLAMSPQTQV